MKKIIVFMLLLGTMAACQDTFEEQDFPIADRTFPEFTANLETSGSDTKTTLGAENRILWKDTDKINVYLKENKATPFLVKKGTEGGTNCSFVKDENYVINNNSRGSRIKDNVAIYYGNNSNQGKLTNTFYEYSYNTTKPKETDYGPVTEPSFSGMVMIAISSSTNLQFKNCYGAVKLQLKGTEKIKKITLKGKEKDFLSGKHTITMRRDGDPAVKEEGTYQTDWFDETSILLDHVQLKEDQATPFYIMVPPADFSSGFDVTIMSDEGGVQTITAPADKQNRVLRNRILTMPEIVVKTEKVQVFSLTHNLNPFNIPLIEGMQASGSILWGDGQTEPYQQNLQHQYQQNGEHIVTIQSTDAEGVTIPSLKGIIKVDLSKF